MDRRHQVRRAVNGDFASVGGFISEYVCNLSRGGAFIRSDDPLPVGTRVNLRFTVVADDLETIEGIGEVVRTIPPGKTEEAGMGVAFRELSDASRQAIEHILVRR